MTSISTLYASDRAKRQPNLMPTILLLKALLQPMSHSFQIRFCFLKADDEAFSGV